MAVVVLFISYSDFRLHSPHIATTLVDTHVI